VYKRQGYKYRQIILGAYLPEIILPGRDLMDPRQNTGRNNFMSGLPIGS